MSDKPDRDPIFKTKRAAIVFTLFVLLFSAGLIVFASFAFLKYNTPDFRKYVIGAFISVVLLITLVGTTLGQSAQKRQLEEQAAREAKQKEIENLKTDLELKTLQAQHAQIAVPKTVYCTYCGAKNVSADKKCSVCGGPINEE